MENQFEQFDTVINGAGPAGLLVACLLYDAQKNQGQIKKMAVFEMRERPTDFYGSFPVVLNKRGLTALSHLGEEFLNKVRQAGVPVEEMNIISNNRTVAKVPASGVCIMRDTVVGLLLKETEKRGIDVRYEKKLKSIDFKARTVTYRNLEKDQEGNTITVVAHRVIAADGNWSKTRRLCVEAIPDFSFETSDWGIFMRFINYTPKKDISSKVNNKVHFVLGADAYTCQQPNGQWSFSLSCPLEQHETPQNKFLNSTEASEENVSKLKEHIRKVGGDLAETILENNEEAIKTFFSCKKFGGAITKCNRLNPTDWLSLVGDAGHSVFPATGEGINSSFESASIWAQCYRDSAPLNDTDDNSSVLYDQRRRADVHALNEIANWNKLKISGAPREKAASTISTIALGIGKKMHLIKGTYQDFMLGKLAESTEVVPYSQLVQMEKDQTKHIAPVANFLAWLFVKEDRPTH